MVRRGNLYPTTGEKGIPSLGLILAYDYLIKQGYEQTTSPSLDLQMGDTVFPIFNSNDGGYTNADDSGYQILMNWYHPPQSFTFISVNDVLSQKMSDDFFQDKIVLIGYYTISIKKDFLYSPWSFQTSNQTPRQIFGVEVHANLISYLINVVTGQKPLLKAVPFAIELGIFTVWITLTGILIWSVKKISSPSILIVVCLFIAGFLAKLCYYFNYQIFLIGWWLPIYPTVGIIVTAISSLFYIFRERNLEYIENLESKVIERTCELESALSNLEQRQNQLIKQEKLAFLGRLTAGFCHQFKNPLYSLKYSFLTAKELLDNIELESEYVEHDFESLYELMSNLQEPIDKLELLFKLILISPTRKNIVWLNTNPNDFVKSITNSCFRFKFLNQSSPSTPINVQYELDNVLNQPFDLPQQLEISIFNIVDNALDALLERVEEKNVEPRLTIKTIKKNDRWQIIISDNAGGIPKSIQRSIFEPFVTTKPETSGIGLGLWISYEMLVSVIGGKIEVETKSGFTHFILTIPLHLNVLPLLNQRL